ncbi:class I SAM-dependent methyltransferase [Nocardia sp. NPDC059691]|uniref:class I SAM-dependent methyltransferase n=1 Tax=Nocardia sp. NPDC059691 TaxID=3346908 RepID=UPI0036AFC195
MEQIDRRAWNHEYESGRWDYLGDTREKIRYRTLGEEIEKQGVAPSVLDLGCGSCLLYQTLGGAGFAGRYLGVDWARSSLPTGPWPPGHGVICADICDLPVAGHFDVIVCNEVLYYLPSPVTVVTELQNRLTPGGIMLISLFQPKFSRLPEWSRHIDRLGAALADANGYIGRRIVTAAGRTWHLYSMRRISR